MKSRIRRFITVILIAASGVATGCDTRASSTPPVACSATIPGVDSYTADELADPWFVDAPFVAWLDSLAGPVDYQSNGFWYDAHGDAVGWSYQEDGEICVIDHGWV